MGTLCYIEEYTMTNQTKNLQSNWSYDKLIFSKSFVLFFILILHTHPNSGQPFTDLSKVRTAIHRLIISSHLPCQIISSLKNFFSLYFVLFLFCLYLLLLYLCRFLIQGGLFYIACSDRWQLVICSLKHFVPYRILHHD